jgi:hypothetical protein
MEDVNKLNQHLSEVKECEMKISEDTAAAASSGLDSVASLVGKVSVLVDDYKTLVGTQVQENVKNVARDIGETTKDKLKGMLEGFEKGEKLLEGEVRASEIRLEKNGEELENEIEKVRMCGFYPDPDRPQSKPYPHPLPPHTPNPRTSTPNSPTQTPPQNPSCPVSPPKLRTSSRPYPPPPQRRRITPRRSTRSSQRP